jgi:hypothetical protein
LILAAEGRMQERQQQSLPQAMQDKIVPSLHITVGSSQVLPARPNEGVKGIGLAPRCNNCLLCSGGSGSLSTSCLEFPARLRGWCVSYPAALIDCPRPA